MSPAPVPHICITIMDDPLYKQSCIRVATSLSNAGYKVSLIGRALPGHKAPMPLSDSTNTSEGEQRFESARDLKSGERGIRTPGDPAENDFRRIRFRTWFNSGKPFYAEMNLRIFLYLLFHKVDLICSVNLDTIVPGWAVSRLKGIPRIYDARELFTELAEIVARPRIQKVWLWVERKMVPCFPQGYAVCASIAEELERRYGVKYAVVRNMTVLTDAPASKTEAAGGAAPDRADVPPFPGKYLLYQGAVNYGRGLDELVDAMEMIDLPLVICGTGNYIHQCQERVQNKGLKDRIHFAGQVSPSELKRYTRHAFIGINLVASEGFNQYYSLPNKLFDYIHAGLPQVTMDYPEYRKVQALYPIGILIPEVSPELIVSAVHQLSTDTALYSELKSNCLQARLKFNWQQEEPVLLEVFRRALK